MIRMYGSKVAVIPIRDPDKIGHIYVPEIAKERVDQGLVKYVGPDVTSVKPGEYVIFSGYTGQLISIEGEGQLIIMPEEFITAVLPDPPNVECPGLYFRGRDGYFPATYEMAMNIIAQSFTEFGATLQITTPKPESKDYDKLRAS